MSLLIDDEDTVAAIRRLAGETGRSEADVVRMAVEAESQRAEEAARRHRAIRSLQDEVRSWAPTGMAADKAFFDDLGGGL